MSVLSYICVQRVTKRQLYKFFDNLAIMEENTNLNDLLTGGKGLVVKHEVVFDRSSVIFTLLFVLFVIIAKTAIQRMAS